MPVVTASEPCLAGAAAALAAPSMADPRQVGESTRQVTVLVLLSLKAVRVTVTLRPEPGRPPPRPPSPSQSLGVRGVDSVQVFP